MEVGLIRMEVVLILMEEGLKHPNQVDTPALQRLTTHTSALSHDNDLVAV